MDEIRIHKQWTLWSLVFLILGLVAVTNESVILYERAYGIYSISKAEDAERYWLFTVMYFNAFIFGLVFAGQEYYPYKIWKLMYLGKGNRVRRSQILFFICVAVLLILSSLFIAGLVGNA